jgi:hypothetical protein
MIKPPRQSLCPRALWIILPTLILDCSLGTGVRLRRFRLSLFSSGNLARILCPISPSLSHRPSRRSLTDGRVLKAESPRTIGRRYVEGHVPGG